MLITAFLDIATHLLCSSLLVVDGYGIPFPLSTSILKETR